MPTEQGTPVEEKNQKNQAPVKEMKPEDKPETQKAVLVFEAFANEIVNYLKTKPFEEVEALIDGLRKSQLVDVSVQPQEQK